MAHVEANSRTSAILVILGASGAEVTLAAPTEFAPPQVWIEDQTYADLSTVLSAGDAVAREAFTRE